jgi:histidinol-phosphate aminotransferase
LRDGVHDLDAMLAAVTPKTKLVFVCDPNNPTGTRVERDALLAFADRLRPGVLLVIDQAYREYMDAAAADGVDVLRRRPATLVLRTASKIYGLASVRFGYGYASPRSPAGSTASACRSTFRGPPPSRSSPRSTTTSSSRAA